MRLDHADLRILQREANQLNDWLFVVGDQNGCHGLGPLLEPCQQFVDSKSGTCGPEDSGFAQSGEQSPQLFAQAAGHQGLGRRPVDPQCCERRPAVINRATARASAASARV